MTQPTDVINMIAVAMPFPHGGGGYRALLAIKEYKKRGINPFLILPWTFNLDTSDEILKNIRFLLREEINVYGDVLLPRFFSFNLPFKKALAKLLISKNLLDPRLRIKTKNIANILHCVMSMHEGFDAVTTSLKISEMFSIRKIVLLQLPPFYGNSHRDKLIKEAYNLWFNVVFDPFLRRTLQVLQQKMFNSVQSKLKTLLNDFDLLIAVSRSIPIEMGEKWLNKVVFLDPGVALSKEDIRLITRIRNTVRKKDKIVVFGGRPRPEKGIIEALIAWKHILKSVSQSYKLVVTGIIKPKIMNKLKKFCRKLGIEEKISFLGYISREKRLSLLAKARMMIYPSHVDAFSYSVLEALNLNTPVVAYDIPAIRMYYDKLEGVTLVKESDVEALAQKTIETIENKYVRVETPKFAKTWDEIMDEETSLIKKFAKKKYF